MAKFKVRIGARVTVKVRACAKVLGFGFRNFKVK